MKKQLDASQTQGMKVLFVGFAITPYYRDFLNRIQTQGGSQVTNIRPVGDNPHLGAGVHQDFSGREFDDRELPECRIAARRRLGLADLEWVPALNSFQGLATLITDVDPAVVVVNVNYHFAFRYDRDVVAAIKRTRSRVVFHSIPFQLDTRDQAIAKLDVPDRLPLRALPAPARLPIQVLGLDRLYLSRIRRPAALRQIDFRARAFRACDAHAVYHEGGIEVYRSYGVEREKIRVVRNSPNTAKLLSAADQHPSNGSSNRLIHIGRLVAWKRVDMLIRSVADLRSSGFPETDLVVIGYGPQEDELRALVATLGLENAVYFRGGIYEADHLAREFADSSIYVMAGMGGLSINEAMCFSVPVVCSRGDGTEKFLVREGVNGMYFEEGNQQSLTAALSTLLADTALRQRMGKESRRIIEKELNTEIHVANYLKLFVDLTETNAN